MAISKITQFLSEKSGGAISKKQAEYLVAGIVIVLIIISIFIMIKSGAQENLKGTEISPTEGYGGKDYPDDYKE